MQYQARSAKKKVILASMILFIALPLSQLSAQDNAQTQDGADFCTLHFETVTALEHQEAGANVTWQTPVGKKTVVEMFTAAYLDQNSELFTFGVSQEDGHNSILYSHFSVDQRRVVNKNVIDLAGLQDVVAAFPMQNQDSAVLFLNRKLGKSKSEIVIATYNVVSGLRVEKTISDNVFDLEVRDVLRKSDNQGWVLAVTARNKIRLGEESSFTQNASLYFLDNKLNVTSSRGYVFGHENEIMSLSVLEADDDRPGYIATGYYRNDGLNTRAWVLRLDVEGAIVWQEEFRRGDSAKFYFGRQAGHDAFYVLGDVSSAHSDLKGVWLMAMDAQNGAPIYSRFFYAKNRVYDYHARGLDLLSDGRLVLLLEGRVLPDAKEAGEESGEIFLDGYGDDFSRILLLDLRGNLIGGASYFFEQGLNAQGMRIDNEKRAIVYGSAWLPSYSLQDYKLSHEKAFDPNVKEPLKDYGDLYEVDEHASEEMKTGFSYLKQKMTEQNIIKKENSMGEYQIIESAKQDSESLFKNNDGWVLVGSDWDVYEDPCADK